jgi:hypothetical protein
MSTSLLYHAFGIRGYDYVKTVYEEGRVLFQIEQPRHGYRNRRSWRHLPNSIRNLRSAIALPQIQQIQHRRPAAGT